MTKINPQKISKWSIGQNVIIEPCIEWNNYHTLDELNEIVINLKNYMPEYEFIIYPKNTYCKEVNGEWNVCFGIIDNKTTYMFMLMICDNLTKCFGCSLLNMEYNYSMDHNSLSEDICPDIYEDLEDTLYDLLIERKENPVLVDCFEI